MDAGSIGTLAALLVALLTFADAALAEGLLLAREGPRSRTAVAALGGLRTAAVIAAATSLAVLLVPRAAPGSVALVALGLFVLLTAAQPWLRTLGRRHAARVAPLVAPLLAPFTWMASLRRGFAQAFPQEGYHPEREEGEEPEEVPAALASLFTEAELARLDEHERAMVRAVLDLGDTWVREVMVPRIDMVAVEVGTPLTEVARRMLECGHNRLPVYRDTIDTILGVVHARDVLQGLMQGEPLPPVERLLRPVFFVPEFKPLDELLQEFKQRRLQVAIVVDEYGGVAGMVTVDDVVREVTGAIEDEVAPAEPEVVLVGEREAIVDARVTLDELNELFDTRLEGDGFDTVGGLVYSLLGKIPAAGDEVMADGLNIRVLSTAGRRIRKLRVSRVGRPEGERTAAK